MSKFYSAIDIYNSKGHLLRTEAYDENGEFIMQALWDPNEAQTYENRVKFREWFYQHMARREDESR